MLATWCHSISLVGSPCLEENLPELCLQTEFREKVSMFFCKKTAVLVPLASCWTFRPCSGQAQRGKPSCFFRIMKLFINGISHVFDFWWIWISARLGSKYCIKFIDLLASPLILLAEVSCTLNTQLVMSLFLCETSVLSFDFYFFMKTKSCILSSTAIQELLHFLPTVLSAMSSMATCFMLLIEQSGPENNLRGQFQE